MLFNRLYTQSHNVNFDDIWKGLKEGISKIITLNDVKGMPMIEDIYKLCTAQPEPHNEKLYEKLRQFLVEHAKQVARKLELNDHDILNEYEKEWYKYHIGCDYCDRIFRYFNNNWILKCIEESRNKLGGLYQGVNSKEVYHVIILCLIVWRDHVFLPLKERLNKTMLEMIKRERDGESIEQNKISKVVISYLKLGIINKNKVKELYNVHFEEYYFDSLTEYYMRESNTFIEQNGVAEYLKKAKDRISEEEIRAKIYLDPSSLEKCRKKVDNVLIEQHKSRLQQECKNYYELTIENPDLDNLKRMHHLLSRIDQGVDPMLSELESFILRFGEDQVGGLNEPSPKDFIEKVLHVYHHVSRIVADGFGNDPLFVKTLDKALRSTFNKYSKTPEYLAKYSDSLLKKGKELPEGVEMEKKLEQIITIFKYLDHRDIFLKFYSKYLATRLITSTSNSDDHEATIISGMKEVSGFDFTNKLQRMFNDMSLCEELNQTFTNHCNKQKISLPIPTKNFSIYVLTQGSWPLHVNKGTFSVPEPLQKMIDIFSEFYTNIYVGRKLSFLHHLCKASVKTNFLEKSYEISVPDYCLSLLLQFNYKDSWTFAELESASCLKESDLTKTISSLISSKLIKCSEKKFTNTSVFDLNNKFKNKHIRFKISAIREAKKESKDTYKQLEEDRKIFLQALLVRIMKARNVLHHNQLVSEVIKQASNRFSPSIQLIKQQIEYLKEKEYIESCEDESAMYKYIA